ncbi:MAG: two-component regulator propeller domain-containing protein, partial [Bacteroidota bacterium]
MILYCDKAIVLSAWLFIMFRLFFFLAILSTGQLYAQEIDWTVDTVDVVLELYGAEDGLSQSFVTAIVQDSSGYIWVGTKDGLNRFDGRTFKVYRSDENNENSLNGNYIVDLLIDKEQRLWVSTEDSGLYFYDSTEDGFTEVHSVNGERIDAPGYLWQPDSALVATSKVHPERSFVLFESPLFGESNHTLKSFVSSFKGASEIVARIKEIENYQRKSSERFPILNSWGDIYFKEDENTISQYALTDGNKYTKRIRKVPKGYILTDYTEVFDNPRSRNVFVTSAEKGFNAKILHLSSVRGDTFDECFSLPSKTGSAEHNEYYYANDSCIIQTSSYKNEIAFIDLPSNKLTVYKSQSSVTGLNAFLLDKDGNLWLRYNPGGLAKLSKNHRKFQRKPSKRRGASWSARFESENQKALYSEFLKDEFEYPSNQLLKEYQKRSLSGYHNVAYA